MSLNHRIAIGHWFFLILFTVFSATQVDGQVLDAKTFAKWHRELTPAKSAFKKIPWETSLTHAQRKAAIDKRPIFIWAMDGHPLGCT